MIRIALVVSSVLLASVLLASCSCGGPAGSSFEITKQGEGPTNEQPLEPAKPGTWYSAGLSGMALVDGVVDVPERGQAKRASVYSAAFSSPSYLSEEEVGEFMVIDLGDAGLSKPVLRVPKTVRLGMEWTTEILNGERAHYVVSERATEVATGFGPVTAWKIALINDDREVLQERQYFEGFGQFSTGLAFFETTLAPQPEVGAPLELEFNGRFFEFSVPGELSFVQLENGEGMVMVQEKGLNFFTPGDTVRGGSCLEYELGNFTTMEGGLVPPWRRGRLECPHVTWCLFGNCDLEPGSTILGSDATGMAVKGNELFTMPRLAQQPYDGYTDRAVVGRVSALVGGETGFFHHAPRGVVFSTDWDQPGEAKVLERRDIWGAQLSVDQIPNAILGLSHISPLGRVVSFPQADGSVRILTRDGNDVLWSTRANFDGAGEEPKMGERFVGRWTVATRPEGTEVLTLDALGHVDRILIGDDGPYRERLGRVKLPRAHDPIGVFRTAEGVMVFTAPSVDNLTQTPLHAWKVKGEFAGSPVRVPRVPTVSVAEAEGLQDFEVCWPSEAGIPETTGWKVGGRPASFHFTATDRHCALLIRETASPDTNSTRIEGSLPGYGRFVSSVTTQQLVGIHGRSFLISGEANTRIEQPVAALPGGEFTNGQYVFDRAGFVRRSLDVRPGTPFGCRADRHSNGVWCGLYATKDFILTNASGTRRMTVPGDNIAFGPMLHVGGMLVKTVISGVSVWHQLKPDGTVTTRTDIGELEPVSNILRDGSLCIGGQKLVCRKDGNSIEVDVGVPVEISPSLLQLDDTHVLVRRDLDWALVDLSARTASSWAPLEAFQAPFFFAEDGAVWGRGGEDTGELQLTPRWPVVAEIAGPKKFEVPKLPDGVPLVDDVGIVAANDELITMISVKRVRSYRFPR